VEIHAATSLPMISALLDAGAAALDQNDQHDNKKYACDDPNNCGAIH